MTICVECGKDKTSYNQGTLGKILAWKCHDCVYKYRKIEFKTIEDERKGIQLIKEMNGGITVDTELRRLFEKNGIEYWLID